MPRLKDYVSNRTLSYDGGVAGRAGALSGRITAERYIRRALRLGKYDDERDRQLRKREMRVLRFAQRNSALGMSAG